MKQALAVGAWPVPMGEDGVGDFVHFIVYPSSSRNWVQVLRTRILVAIHGDKRTEAFRIAPGFQSLGWAVGTDESPEDRNCARLVHHIVAAQ